MRDYRQPAREELTDALERRVDRGDDQAAALGQDAVELP
jgi:hypothetical protein